LFSQAASRFLILLEKEQQLLRAQLLALLAEHPPGQRVEFLAQQRIFTNQPFHPSGQFRDVRFQGLQLFFSRVAHQKG
jgi:hypothetical protein